MRVRTRTALLPLPILVLLAAISTAQQGPFLIKHKEFAPEVSRPTSWHRPATQRSLVGGPWMIGPDMKATVTIKNVVEVAPITVTPILYLSNGHKFTLPNMRIEAAGTVVIDINQALQDHWGISSWATLVGYVEIQYALGLGCGLRHYQRFGLGK